MSSEIESLSLNDTHTLGLAQFSNEATQSVEVSSGHGSELAIMPDDAYQDVKRYFERPRLITKINAATTVTSPYVDSFRDPVTEYWPAVAVNRLNGVYGYRATIKYTLTLASTPFQQGMAVLSFQHGTDSTQPKRAVFPPLAMNLPHARLNFADTTIAELTIPYLSPWDFFELNNSAAQGGDTRFYEYGTVAVTQIMPYRVVPGDTPPKYSLYVSLHDMELFGATPTVFNAIIPQSGSSALSTMNKEAKKSKVVSKSLNTVSKAADVVTKVAAYTGIPFLGATAGTVSWLSKKLAGGAKAFGYSKPIIEAPPARSHFSSGAMSSCIDTEDVAVPVAPFASNRLDVSTVTGCEVDEMSLPYVLSNYSLCFQGVVDTTYADGTFIYASRVCPTNYWYRTNAGLPGGNLPLPPSSTLTTNAILPTTLCYVSQAFRYWRGSIKFRFTFAKTKFHAGRLVATFVPNTSDVISNEIPSAIVPLPEVANGGIQPFTTSAIFDLKDDSSFELEVPYMCARPWLSTGGSVGGVSLAVLDAVRTTGQTTSAINFLVEVAAGPDFELANYCGTSLVTPTGANIDSQVIVAQAAEHDAEITDDSIAEVCQYTMGEKITSMKEIIQVPTYSARTFAAPAAPNYPLHHWSYNVRASYGVPFPYSGAPNTYINSGGNFAASMYAFVSGGTMYRANVNGVPCSLSIRQFGNPGNFNPATVGDPRDKGNGPLPVHFHSGTAATCLHAKCPTFQRTRIIPVHSAAFFPGTPLTAAPSLSYANIYINSNWVLTASAPNTAVVTLALGVSAADDAKCHQFIGPPPVILLASTSTSNIFEDFFTF